MTKVDKINLLITGGAGFIGSNLVEHFLDNDRVAQVLTYLRLGNYKLGLLLNFNERLLKNGVKRIIY